MGTSTSRCERRAHGATAHSRRAGLSLVEVVLGATILAAVAFASSLAVVSGIRQRRESFNRYTVLTALRDVVAEIQDVANQPQDLAAGTGIGSVFATYSGHTRSVPELTAGEISITCHANETSVPPEIGGPQDLNFDGDASDDLSTAEGGADLKLVPLTLTLTFQLGGATHTLTLHRLIAQTT